MGPASRPVEVLFFGRLGQAAGGRRRALPLPDPATVEEVWRLAVRGVTELETSRPTVRAALNESLVAWDALVTGGDRVAFLPPVCGG